MHFEVAVKGGRQALLPGHGARFTAPEADRIYVLREGEVIESGSHDELVAAGGLYSELFALQASSYLPERQHRWSR